MSGLAPWAFGSGEGDSEVEVGASAPRRTNPGWFEVGILDTEATHCPDVRTFSGRVEVSAIGRWPRFRVRYFP